MSRNIHCFLVIVLLSSVTASANAATVINGGLKMNGIGSGLMFPDASIQTQATVQGPKGDIGPKGDTGPKGDIGPQGDTGPQGPPGNSGKWVKSEEMILNIIDGSIVRSIYNYDTAGHLTCVLVPFNSTTSMIQSYTVFDAHGNPTVGKSYAVQSPTPPSVQNLTISYTYDASGRISTKTQTAVLSGFPPMISTYVYSYFADNTHTETSSGGPQSMVSTFDANNNLLSSVANLGGNISTTTYAYTYDANGNPISATVTNNGVPAFESFTSWIRL